MRTPWRAVMFILILATLVALGAGSASLIDAERHAGALQPQPYPSPAAQWTWRQVQFGVPWEPMVKDAARRREPFYLL